MNKSSSLLSIIIPTKNRYATLLPVINTLVKNIKNIDLEFIIQDNSGENAEGILYFEKSNDTRIKYFYTKESLSIQDNTVKAIDNANGKYLIFIGDDDLVSPHIYEVVKYLDQYNIECLVYNAAYYWWNTVDFAKENYFHRKKALWIPVNQNLDLIERNSNEELTITLQSGAGIFSRLPKFYHGIVKREVLEKIKEKVGTYLPGSSPDIAFSTALALVVDKYYYVNFPVSVFGASKNSGGGMTARKRHFGKIEDQMFLPKNIIEKWNAFIPRIWSEKSIYAQTVTEVLTAFKSKNKFNFLVFYGTMLAYEPYLIRYIIPSIKAYNKYNIINYFKITYVFAIKRAGIIFRKLKFISKTYEYEVVLASNVDEVMNELKKTAINFNKLDYKFKIL
jgi:glycosyltransferase involved in cell wall biosynthesis